MGVQKKSNETRTNKAGSKRSRADINKLNQSLQEQLKKAKNAEQRAVLEQKLKQNTEEIDAIDAMDVDGNTGAKTDIINDDSHENTGAKIDKNDSLEDISKKTDKNDSLEDIGKKTDKNDSLEDIGKKTDKEEEQSLFLPSASKSLNSVEDNDERDPVTFESSNDVITSAAVQEGKIIHSWGQVLNVFKEGPRNAARYFIVKAGRRHTKKNPLTDITLDQESAAKKSEKEFCPTKGSIKGIKAVAWQNHKGHDRIQSLVYKNWLLPNGNKQRPAMRIEIRWNVGNNAELLCWEKRAEVERSWQQPASPANISGNRMTIDKALELRWDDDTILVEIGEVLDSLDYYFIKAASITERRYIQWQLGQREGRDKSPSTEPVEIKVEDFEE
jgi:hypothetical protein